MGWFSRKEKVKEEFKAPFYATHYDMWIGDNQFTISDILKQDDNFHTQEMSLDNNRSGGKDKVFLFKLKEPINFDPVNSKAKVVFTDDNNDRQVNDLYIECLQFTSDEVGPIEFYFYLCKFDGINNYQFHFIYDRDYLKKLEEEKIIQEKLDKIFEGIPKDKIKKYLDAM